MGEHDINPGSSVVLVVDDDASQRRLFRALLERRGYRVIEAVDGLDGIQLARATSPSVILMDRVMPNLDGLEATRSLRGDLATRDMPIIMVSGCTDQADIDAGLAAGADDYLIKPVAARDLESRVRAMARLGSVCNELRRSYDILGEQTRALSLLLELGACLSHCEDFDLLVETVVQFAARLTFCRRIALLLPDAEGHVLRVAASVGFPEQSMQSVAIPNGNGLTGRVFQTGEKAIFNTPLADGDRAQLIDFDLTRGEPMVACPMRGSERPVGVLLVVDRLNGRCFTPQELEYLDLICNNAASAIEAFTTRRAREDARDSIVVALAQLAEHRDNDTGKHLDRMTGYCLCLARTMQSNPLYAATITPEFIRDLERAAPLHDIGKVAIPDHILLKPGKLTLEEMAIMRTHAIVGMETIRSVLARTPGSTFLKMAEEIAHGHHEWYNGMGYPRGLSGEAIPISARIAALADVYDALTSRRVYKKAMSHDAARELIIQSRDEQFDPDVVDAFLQCEAEFKQLATRLADQVGGKGPNDILDDDGSRDRAAIRPPVKTPLPNIAVAAAPKPSIPHPLPRRKPSKRPSIRG